VTAVEPIPLLGGDVAAVLAHEMRGPLMALVASTELLVEDAVQLDPAEVRDLARTIRGRALWIQGLVENLLCASALRRGRLRLRLQALDPHTLLEEVRVLLEPLLAQRRQSLRLRRPLHPSPHTMADARRLSQVLVNLILNASKYAPPATSIDLSLRASNGRVRFLVADQGPGLPAGDRARLFDPYWQAAPGQAVPDEQADGLGLGLAIARAIVDAHDGRIGARNRRGRGAVFWFDLPAVPARVVPPAMPAGAPTEATEGPIS
jgi:two-component system sensor histidine kinase KdpD